MRIVFFGSGNFAVLSLKALIKSRHEILCVLTQPDRKQGRHFKLGFTPVKAAALFAGLKVFQPVNVNAASSLEFLKKLCADLFVVVAYGQLLSDELLGLPALMPINLHASQLPRYRGAAPINWAIINGDKKTGVSIMYMVAKMDAGPLIAQREVKIEDQDTAVTLEEKLGICGAGLLTETLESIQKRDYRLVEQDEDKAVYAPKLKKETGWIDWHTPAVAIHNQIRGLLLWPGAFTSYRRKMLKIFSAQVLTAFPSHQPLPGEVVWADASGIVVACGKGFLKLLELQLEGARRMSVQDFMAGHKLAAGEVLGKNSCKI